MCSTWPAVFMLFMLFVAVPVAPTPCCCYCLWVHLYSGPSQGFVPNRLTCSCFVTTFLFVGESRETADLMSGVAMLMEAYLSRAARAEVIRTWGSMLAMLPVGGTTVWGNANWAPDDTENVTAAGRSFG